MPGENAHYYEPSKGHGLRHDPFNAVIGPRPIGWISTLSPTGVRNLAPYSFFNAFNYSPPVIGFSTIRWKDTVANVDASGEFVWNLATKTLAHEMNVSAAHFPSDVDEIERAGLTSAPGRLVAAPRVLESPVNFECKLSQLIRLKDSQGREADSWLILGEVVAAHIDPAFIRDGVYQTCEPHPILRAGRMGDYVEVTPAALFEMPRPD